MHMRRGRCKAMQQRCIRTHASSDYREKAASDIRVLVVGSTGYIGKFVVKELVKRGYNVVAFAREKSGVGGKVSKDEAAEARMRTF